MVNAEVKNDPKINKNIEPPRELQEIKAEINNSNLKINKTNKKRKKNMLTDENNLLFYVKNFLLANCDTDKYNLEEYSRKKLKCYLKPAFCCCHWI